jgi:SAM-dependent methyltransferase
MLQSVDVQAPIIKQREGGERCPLCGGRRWQTLFSARGHDIARCEECRVVRTLGVEVTGQELYPPFDQRDTPIVRLMRFGVQQLLRERGRYVRQLQPRGRLLDFGCGSGAFATMMASGGAHEVVGVEPFSLGRPVEKPRLRLVRAPLEMCRAELGQFDVVTVWSVVEHVENPAELLADLFPHLRPGGVMIVSVPNFASWQSRLFGPKWFHLDPPRHISHFEPDTMRRLLTRLGLEVFNERSFHIEYGPVGWIQSALNAARVKHNFMFEFVKDRGALASLSSTAVAANLAASVAGAAALFAPALLVEAAAALVQAGSMVTVAARKKNQSS